ncbi:MAG: hypothetical protein M1837_000410 [Sclerophora amabilis]|nr:MAG: hypothetical protein M1837_000410 [Sclerophora amabilis]
MNSFSDILIEKLAGRGATERLHRRRLEEQFRASMAAQAAEAAKREQADLHRRAALAAISSRSVDASFDLYRPAPVTTSPPRPGTSPLVPVPYPLSTQDGAFQIPGDPQSRSLDAEQTYPPDFPRAQKSWVSLEESYRQKRYNKTVTFRSETDHGRGRMITIEAPTMYSIPKLTPMEGCGKFRRAITATEEWKRQRYNEDPQRTELWPVASSSSQPASPGHSNSRKGSNSTSQSSLSNGSEVEIDSETGSIIIRGGFDSGHGSSASEAAPLPPWRARNGNRTTASPHPGFGRPVFNSTTKTETRAGVDELAALVKEKDALATEKMQPGLQSHPINIPRRPDMFTTDAAMLAKAVQSENVKRPARIRRSNTVRLIPKMAKISADGEGANHKNVEQAIDDDASDLYVDDEQVAQETRKRQERRARSGLTTTRPGMNVVIPGPKKRVEFKRQPSRSRIPLKAAEEQASSREGQNAEAPHQRDFSPHQLTGGI